MPIYEYKCEDCGHETSILILNADEDHVPSCPECGRKAMKKMFSTMAVLVKKDSCKGSLSCGLKSPCAEAPYPCGKECGI